MMVDLSSIAKADVLRGLTTEDLVELGAVACETEFERRHCLFRRGEEAETFYVATRGRFILTVDLRLFDSYVEMAVEEKGALDAFGWSSLVEPRTSIYSGYCIEDGAAVAFPSERLDALMTANSRLGAKLLHNLNELIGTRVRVLQNLWLDEISQSMTRVQHWTQTELSTQWSAAMTESGPRPPMLRWIRRLTRLRIEE